MRKGLVLLGMLLWSATAAMAQLNIGINVSLFPQLVMVPGYPVYYAPDLDSNYFFFDGAYWVYQNDNWYSSAWYNGPWELMNPEFVPLYVLRIPVQYYRRPPQYFRGWQTDAPPHWGERWGNSWSQRRSGWDQWDHRSAPAAAPLPVYQRQYSGDKYPPASQQKELQSRNNNYRGQSGRDAQAERSSQRDRPQQAGERGAPKVSAPPMSHAPSQQSPREQQSPRDATRNSPASSPPPRQVSAPHEEHGRPPKSEHDKRPEQGEQHGDKH